MRFDLVQVFPCLTGKATPPCDPVMGGGSAPPKPIPCCEDADFSDSNPTVCVNDDPRCSDPSFAQSNPGLCPNANRLILKPAYALKEALQQFTYELYFLQGGTETKVDSGVTFQCGNPVVALVGGVSGKCTATNPGIATVSAQWGGLTAYAQLEVVASCAAQETDFLFLIDHSASMGQTFSGFYQSKLSFARTMASQMVGTMDLSKDRVAVWQFSTQGTELLTFSQDANAIQNAIGSIGQTDNRTNLKLPLGKAIAELTGQATPNKTLVIVLFSDGENKTGGNPLPEARSFETGRGVIMVVGCRAYDGGFMLLEDLASGGFFINALGANQASVPAWLSGLKSYLCSGNCTPAGNRTVPYAALDYAGFVNWDVTGKVDLIGNGGVPLFDILPGNGLYVDLCGSSPAYLGKLTGKTAKMPNAASGGSYTLSLFLAGNQREIQEGRQVRVRLTVNGVADVDQTVTITDAYQAFTKYSFQFISSGTGPAIISIEQTVNPGVPFFGTLLDVVELKDNGTSLVVFHDDFDGENPTFFPPNCVSQNQLIPFGGQAYSYCYSSGCLDTPIPAQVPDPTPTTDIESCAINGVPPNQTLESILGVGGTGLGIGDGGLLG